MTRGKELATKEKPRLVDQVCYAISFRRIYIFFQVRRWLFIPFDMIRKNFHLKMSKVKKKTMLD